MDFRMADKNDIKLLTENRVEFVTSIRNIEDVDKFRLNIEEYITEHIEKDDFIAFLAVEDGVIISSLIGIIFDIIPLPSCPNGKRAELLNVYTLKEHRRKGYSQKLIGMLIDEVKKRGADKIVLSATEDGYPLYKKLGFVDLEREMELKL